MLSSKDRSTATSETAVKKPGSSTTKQKNSSHHTKFMDRKHKDARRDLVSVGSTPPLLSLLSVHF